MGKLNTLKSMSILCKFGFLSVDDISSKHGKESSFWFDNLLEQRHSAFEFKKSLIKSSFTKEWKEKMSDWQFKHIHCSLVLVMAGNVIIFF